jgi:O-antigen ligase
MILAASGIPLVIHSTYLWLLAELGVLGFMVFVAPAAFVLWAEIRRTARDEASVVLILCLVGFAAMSIPADMMYQRTFWLVCGAALASAPRPEIRN